MSDCKNDAEISQSGADLRDYFPGGSEMSVLMRRHDWSATPLGHPRDWPENLRSTIRMMLTSRFDMWVGWGADLLFFYNDAYIHTLGHKHPKALARPVKDVWCEIYADVSGRFDQVTKQGETTWDKALLLLLERHGFPEETYHTFSYSPLWGDQGRIDGLICIVTEETERVLSERRLETTRELAMHLLPVRTPARLIDGVVAALHTNGYDFPFAALRLFDYADLPLGAMNGLGGLDWPYAQMVEACGPVRVDLANFDAEFPTGAWNIAPTHAVMVPVFRSGQAAPIGALIIGENPYRPNDSASVGLASLLVSQISGALATIESHMTEAAETSLLRTLFEQSPSFMAVLRGPDYRFELINPSCERLLSGRQVIGMSAEQALPEFRDPSLIDLLEWVSRTGEPYLGNSKEIGFVLPDGSIDRRYLDFVLQPMRNHLGVITGIFVEGVDVTAARLADHALRDSEAKFRMLAQAMPNQVWSASADGGLDWFNAQVVAYAGIEFSELFGMGWMQILHPDDAEHTGQAWKNALETGGNFEIEFRIRRFDGVYRWHLARALPIRDEAGRVARWIGTSTDIHERKLAAAESERDRLRIWNLSPVLKFIGSMTGEIEAVNPAWSRTLGWSAEETLGRHIMDFVIPDDRAACAEGFLNRHAGEPGSEFRSHFVVKTGSNRLLAWTTLNEGGRLYAFGRDITVESEAENALAASMAERERIWSSTNDLMATSGMDGYLKNMNPAWKNLLGYSEEELLSRPFAEFIVPEDRGKLQDALARLAEGERLSDLEQRLLHDDGSRSLISFSAEPAGSVFYMVGRNVTEQRNVEDALRQSQKMEAVGQLTGGIAHDFNNLLQGITGSLDLVQKRIAQGRVTELERFVTGAMNSANRATSLTHRLLAFSRRQPLDPKPVRANPLVASMEELLRRTLGERIHLELVLAGGLWLTLCDPNQLENAVLNLVINARDAMPDGGKLIIETCNAHLDAAYSSRQRDVKAGQYICVGVTDNGTGMDSSIMARAFEPFFTTKPLGQGTGLGLSMIYGFARQSEGYAKIYSEVGKGTTVKLYLPRHRGETEEEDTGMTRTIHSAADDHGETVLVVEDEPVVRGLIVEILADLGYHALEACDGASGLQILQSNRRIDLLITDIGLPVLNGRQVADAARTIRPNLKVLFMTGYAENAALATGFLEPGMMMITKPFAMDVLTSRIRDILNDA